MHNQMYNQNPINPNQFDPTNPYAARMDMYGRPASPMGMASYPLQHPGYAPQPHVPNTIRPNTTKRVCPEIPVRYIEDTNKMVCKTIEIESTSLPTIKLTLTMVPDDFPTIKVKTITDGQGTSKTTVTVEEIDIVVDKEHSHELVSDIYLTSEIKDYILTNLEYRDRSLQPTFDLETLLRNFDSLKKERLALERKIIEADLEDMLCRAEYIINTSILEIEDIESENIDLKVVLHIELNDKDTKLTLYRSNPHGYYRVSPELYHGPSIDITREKDLLAAIAYTS